VQANAGVSLGRFGSLGVVYARVDGPLFNCSCTTTNGGLSAVASGPPGLTPTGDHAALASASYSARIAGKVSLAASAFRDLDSGGWGGSVVMTVPFGRRSVASPTMQYEGGRLQPTFQLSRSSSRPGEWGWQFYDAEGGSATRRFGELQYTAGWGAVSAGVDAESQGVTGRLMLRGAFTLLDGGAFLSPPIQDSFAVVDTSGKAGLSIFVENQLAGKTNSGGRLLLPDLRSWVAARVAINPADLTLDSEVSSPDLIVRPPDHSGVVANFDIKTIDQALVTLVDDKGAPLPAGSLAAMANNPERFPVGYDGQLYLKGPERHTRLEVELPTGERCAVEFDYKRVKGDIARIGPVPCRSVPAGVPSQVGPIEPPVQAPVLRGRIDSAEKPPSPPVLRGII
jgi:outer membrane usher protein